MKNCPECHGEIQDAAVVCKHCKANLSGFAASSLPSAPAPGSNPPTPAILNRTRDQKRVEILLLFILILSFLSCLGVWLTPMIYRIGTKGDDGRLLFVGTTRDRNESFGIDKFEKALKTGGDVVITVEEIIERHSSFEDEYAISGPDKKYRIRSAIVNFITSRGWRYAETDGDRVVFRRK